MFVRIIFSVEGKQDKEEIYQCDSVSMWQKDDDHVFLEVSQMNRAHNTTYELEKHNCEVYYMNDEGKTIDSYRWAT